MALYLLLLLQEAELAKERTHGYKLDKAHIFAVNLFDDFDKFMKVPDEWAPPEIKPYAPGVPLFKPFLNVKLNQRKIEL